MSLQVVRWRDGVWVRVAADGAAECGLREEEQAGVLCVPRAPDLDRGGGALQLRADHAHQSGARGRVLPRRQRGHLRHLRALPRRRQARSLSLPHTPHPPTHFLKKTNST